MLYDSKASLRYQAFTMVPAPQRKIDMSVQPIGAMFAGVKTLFDRGWCVLVNSQVLTYMKTLFIAEFACLFAHTIEITHLVRGYFY